MEQKVKIEIPRDFNTSDIKFITSCPRLLDQQIDEVTYTELIDTINNVFKPKYSLLNILKITVLMPFLLSDFATYDEEVEKVLKKMNNKVKQFNLYFEHPKFTNYINLVVYKIV